MAWQNPRQDGAYGSAMTDAYAGDRSALATKFLNQVFGWMAGGLAASGAVAYAVLSSRELFVTVAQHYFLFAILQIVAVMAFSGLLHRMSVAVAAATFLGYSALTGLTLGVIVSMFTMASVANAFFVSAGTFGAMAFIGATTKKNLSGLGSFLMMGVIAILLASVLNFFLHSGALDFAVSVLGALIFTGLAAVDVQRFKALGMMGFSTEREASQMALRGALNLYLDFINMFLFLLRLFGNRRN